MLYAKNSSVYFLYAYNHSLYGRLVMQVFREMIESRFFAVRIAV